MRLPREFFWRGGGRIRRRRGPCGRRSRGGGQHRRRWRGESTPAVARPPCSRDGGGPAPAGMAVSACLEDVRSARQVERAKILGDHHAHPPVAHLEEDLNPSLAVTTVNADGTEALAERLRIGELVREVQQRLGGCGRPPVGALGAGADFRRPQGTDPVRSTCMPRKNNGGLSRHTRGPTGVPPYTCKGPPAPTTSRKSPGRSATGSSRCRSSTPLCASPRGDG